MPSFSQRKRRNWKRSVKPPKEKQNHNPMVKILRVCLICFKAKKDMALTPIRLEGRHKYKWISCQRTTRKNHTMPVQRKYNKAPLHYTGATVSHGPLGRKSDAHIIYCIVRFPKYKPSFMQKQKQQAATSFNIPQQRVRLHVIRTLG